MNALQQSANSASEQQRNLSTLLDLLASGVSNSTPNPIRQPEKVEPWEYGAKVSARINGRDVIEYHAFPPPVDRFCIGTYNKIVMLINQSVEELK